MSELDPGRRQHRPLEDRLILREVPPRAVLDGVEHDTSVCHLATFGTIRETCPKCLDEHLKLVLRQANVRAAHLLCARCGSCFDAHYANGEPALSI